MSNVKQVFNPYLPSWEYVPDGEPHIFNDRLYVYGSHDRFNGTTYCMEPYVCWSAPLTDLSDWTYHGIIYTGEDDILNDTKKRLMFAPDVVEHNEKYYLYYGLDTANTISVAVADKPEGPFSFYGNVRHQDGEILGLKQGDEQQFDPGIFKDDDGSIYLYSGFSSTPEVIERIKKKINDPNVTLHISTNGSFVTQLEDDMLTIKYEPKSLLPGVSNSKGTGFEGHEFYEASSMRKFKGKYYAIYSSVAGHELCYAMSDYPDKDFVYKGVLHSNGNLGICDEPTYYYANNHGSVIEIHHEYYVFGHRHTNYTQFQRQGVAEKLHMNEDGTFEQAEMTSCGLNQKPLIGQGCYPSYIACVLQSKDGACKQDVKIDKEKHPAVTQDEDKIAFITNIQDKTVIGFKYFSIEHLNNICVQVQATDYGVVRVKTNRNEKDIAKIEISPTDSWQYFCADANVEKGIHALYFIYEGKGKLKFRSFQLN